MENFTIETRYLMLCKEFRTVIRFMKAAFYRPYYQKTLNVSVDQKTRPICFKTCDRAFEIEDQAFETPGQAFKTLGRAFEDLREN